MTLPILTAPERDALIVLRALPWVLGVGFGFKERGGVPTGIPAWRVYVIRKKPMHLLTARERVPEWVAGAPTDVVEKAPTRPTAAGPAAVPPAPGARIANARGVPGTLGCLAVTGHDGRPVLLSNHHVLFGGGASEREPVWRVEGDGAGAAFRRLGSTLYGRLGTVPFGGTGYYVDCAVASLDGEAGLPPDRLSMLRHGNAAPAAPGDRVTKTGGATGTTVGIVVDVAYPDVACIEGRTRDAPRQILVRPADGSTPFSADGDSGAVLFDAAGQPVGLLWGVNHRGESVGCHIAPVLQVLGIRLARWVAPRAPPLPRGADRFG